MQFSLLLAIKQLLQLWMVLLLPGLPQRGGRDARRCGEPRLRRCRGFGLKFVQMPFRCSSQFPMTIHFIMSTILNCSRLDYTILCYSIRTLVFNEALALIDAELSALGSALA